MILILQESLDEILRRGKPQRSGFRQQFKLIKALKQKAKVAPPSDRRRFLFYKIETFSSSFDQI
jgi:hypothetical protein